MAGRLERSRERFERFDRREAEEADRECCGEVSILNVVVIVVCEVVEEEVSRAAVVGWL
jgi:hypothetical protein